MRFIFLTGGFVGFLAVAIVGLSVGRAIDLVLRDAAIGALVGGFLFRWFWAIFVKLLSQAVRAKRAAEAAAEATAAAAVKSPATPATAKVK
jgi:hypothetical protein